MDAKKKVKLTKEDKQIFAKEMKSATPWELLSICNLIDDNKDKFTAADWKFMSTHIGKRCTKLLYNVGKNCSFEDSV